MIIEYTGAQKLKGSLLFFEPIENVQYGEKVRDPLRGKNSEW
jgi:hypothetical protein